MKLNSN